jgi:low temperature requirement protein LtrA
MMSCVYRRQMTARSTTEPHRSATSLELFFDLCFVVAVAQAGSALHHDLVEGHLEHAVPNYVLVFFAIWWAWVNFTWFASAYDTDDDWYRLTTFVQITGALTMAAGVPRAFDQDYRVVTIGYVVMRLAMIGQWLRAARDDPPRRVTAQRFAIGVAVVQLGWILRLLLDQPWYIVAGIFLIVAELAVPVWAERAERTTWHPRHITERYGLFTLIVLGEAVLGATIAIQTAADAQVDGSLLLLVGSSLILIFALWWLYFDRPAPQMRRTGRDSFIWGYGHFFIFMSTAAVGAGLAVAVDHLRHRVHLSDAAAGLAVGVPVSIWLVSVWLLHRRAIKFPPVVAVLVLAAAWTPVPVTVIAVLVALLAVGITAVARREAL